MVQDRHFEPVSLLEACRDAHVSRHHLNALTEQWHSIDLPQGGTDLLAALHAANFELWHLEDEARDRHASDAAVARSKRAIDAVNQRRNDLTEQIDTELLRSLSTAANDSSVPLHSETPGQMLDRLSILALKIFHTEEETHRENTTAQHRDRNAARLVILQQQQHDLADCLTELWRECQAGTRRFKQYRQYKMYNDPELNPVLYNGRPRDVTG